MRNRPNRQTNQREQSTNQPTNQAFQKSFLFKFNILVFVTSRNFFLALMLRVFSLTGETLATFSAEEVEGKSVKSLKTLVGKQIGVRQKWLAEDHSELKDNDFATASDVQLVVLDFVQADAEKEVLKLADASQTNSLEQVEELLRKPLNPNALSEVFGPRSALHLAAGEGHLEVVKLLLEAKANREARDSEDRTALLLAANSGHAETVKLLLEVGADKGVFDSYDMTALHIAAGNGHAAVVKLLLEAGAETEAVTDQSWTALHCAAAFGRTEVVKLLLEAGAEKEAVTDQSWTALHCAAAFGRTEVVKLLLEAGAEKEAVTDQSWTALHGAAAFGRTEVVKLLLEAGAEKEAADSIQRTALHFAAAFGRAEANVAGMSVAHLEQGCMKVVKLLLAARADQNLPDFDGKTPMDLAILRENHTIENLLKSEHLTKRQPLCFLH